MKSLSLGSAGAALALAVYAVLLVRANSSIAGGADSSGYLNEARLLARGRLSEEIAALALLGLPPRDHDLFLPLGYRSGPRPGTMAPSYPPGLPLHMAALGILVAALLIARDVPLPQKWKRMVGPAILAGIVAVGVIHIARFQLLSMGRGERIYRDASRGAASLVPARSLIAAMQMSGALKYYAERPSLRWDHVSPERFAEIRRRAEERSVPLYALLWPFEVADFANHLPGEWEPVGRWRDVVLFRLE